MNNANEMAKELFYSFRNILKRPEMRTLPGQLAFYFIMAIVPIATITTVIASYITKNINFTDTVNVVLPPVFVSILKSISTNLHFKGVAFVLILYLIVGSNAPGTIIIASNVFYEIDQPNFIKLKLKSFIMTIMIVFLLLFVVIIPLFGDIIFHFLTVILNSNIIENHEILYVVIKATASFLVMYFIIKFLYTYAPSKRIDNRTTIKGSLFTSVGWILATYIFAFYITNIASYDVVYGNFANILILLLWVYILAYLFVVGMALNVDEFHKQRKCTYEEKVGEKKVKRNNKK